MKVKSSKDTKMKRLGAEELVELGKYRLSKGRSKASKSKNIKLKWCVSRGKNKKCYKTMRELKKAMIKWSDAAAWAGLFSFGPL